jgi:hypothetical protein
MHMECNYGDMFPTGWVWAQGCSNPQSVEGASHDFDGAGSTSSAATCAAAEQQSQLFFVMTGGLFKIGPVTTRSWVLALRWASEEWNFRSTDLDTVEVAQLSREQASIRLVATSRCRTRRMEVGAHACQRGFDCTDAHRCLNQH